MKPLSIIIADDDEDDRELLKFLFNQNERFELMACYSSGLEVVEEIIQKKRVPDILLIDMYMPFLTGVEVVKKIEDSGVAPNMSKFIISTTINLVEQDRHIDNATVKFIEKPVSLVQINDLPGIILESLNHNNNTKV